MGSARWTVNDTHARLLPAGRWDIDTRYSAVSFGGRYLGVLPVRGSLARITGEMFVEPDTGAAVVAVLIDAATVSTPMAQFDARLRSGDFLDVARHPRIGFRSTALWFDDPCWQMAGNLAVKDTVSTVVLHVAPTGVTQHPITGARYARFTATAELDRFSIGLGSNRERPDDRPRLSNTVHVQADIVAVLCHASPGHLRSRRSQPIRNLGSSPSPGPAPRPCGAT